MKMIWLFLSQCLIIAALFVLLVLMVRVLRILTERAAPVKTKSAAAGPPAGLKTGRKAGRRKKKKRKNGEKIGEGGREVHFHLERRRTVGQESPEPEKRQTPVPEPEPSEPEKRRASVPEPPEPKKGRTPPSPELPEPENICLLCGLAVDKAIDFNPDGPVRLQVISEEGADFLLYSDMRVEPGKRCYSGFNGMAYFRNRHFNLLYEFRNRAGDRMETDRADRTLRCLRLEKPAAVSVSGEGYILKEKGILIMEER